MKNKLFYLLVMFIALSILIFPADVQKVMVKKTLGNIRTKPGLIGKIIRTAQKGDTFILLGKNGTWYKIALAIDKIGDSEFGYVHSSIVRIVSESSDNITSVSNQYTAPVVSKPRREYTEPSHVSRKTPGMVFHQDKLFSGFFSRIGWMTSPDVENFSEKWISSFGFDTPIGKYATWGLEFQPYYRNFSNVAYDMTITTVSSNIFLNFKGGIKLGQFVRSLKFLTIYSGGGIGTNLAYISIKYDGAKGNQFDTNLAWHILFGIELKFGRTRIVIEIQKNRIILKDVEPATQSYNFILFGIRFK